MLARIRKSAEHKDSGFTLIELLVVMIIIGILAAIAIPAFLSQKNKAKSTSAKSDVSTIGKEIASYFVDESTIPAAADEFAIVDDTASPQVWTFGNPEVTGTLSAGNTAIADVTTASDWCVTVWNMDVDGDGAAPAADDAATWSYDSLTGLQRGTC